jgi:hypothetical protein
MKKLNIKLSHYRLCFKPLNFEEWLLLLLFFGTGLYVFLSGKEFLLVPLFVYTYLIPVSTFANNFANLLFLFFWITGLILGFVLFEVFFFIGPSVMLLLYFVAKYIFLSKYKKDLVFGSSSAALISNRWYSGKSRIDSSSGGIEDKNYQMVLIFIAIACLCLGSFNQL